MFLSKSIQLTLLILLLGISFSCNKVKETPEPDTFSTTPLHELEYQANGGTVELNVLAANQLTSQVTLSFDKPRQGKVVHQASSGKFLYVANPGFEGKDSLIYNVCKSSQCKNGRIVVTVTNNPVPACKFNFANAASDTFHIYLSAGPQEIRTKVFPGDVYCPESIPMVITNSNPFISQLAFVQVRYDSIFMFLNKPVTRNLVHTIGYVVCDSSVVPNACIVRYLKVHLTTNDEYCNDIFKVSDRTFPISSNTSDTITVGPNTFISQVVSCLNEVDPNYFTVSSTPNLGTIQVGRNFKVFKKPGAGPRFLYYFYRNIRNVTDSGSVKIEF